MHRDPHYDYTLDYLDEDLLDPNPFVQFELWLRDAIDAQIIEPYAMSLATATKDGEPSARIVLLRNVDERGFVFYTNYESRKGRDLTENPRAALTFYWDKLERQVRVSGTVTKVSREESTIYFHSRHRGSQLGAWASHQSHLIASRSALEESLKQAEKKYGQDDIPLPPYWGGFRVAPLSIEFWQGRPNRLHDRLRYMLDNAGTWYIERLSP